MMAMRNDAAATTTATAATATATAAATVTAPEDQKSKINVLRFVFIGSMAAAAAVCGSIAYVVVRHLEDDLASQTFRSVANSALKGAQAITSRKVQAGSVLTSYHSYAFPNASQWPFVALPGFMDTAIQLDYISNSLAFLVNTIVQPDQVSEYEAFAEQVYKDHGYPNNSGVSAFGFGIWARTNGTTNGAIDNRAHDTSGNTTYGSKYAILAPVFQISNVSIASALMYNSFSDPLRGRAIGSILDCAAAAAAAAQTAATATANSNNAAAATATRQKQQPSCGVVSEFTELITEPGKQSAILYLPIFPVNDPTTVVGLISTSLLWEEVLTNVVPDYVNGLICVVSTIQKSHTYVIRNGVPVWEGEGDLHDLAYDRQGKKVVLNDVEISTVGSTIYTVTVYPSSLMFDEFHTNNPLGIALGFVAVILFSASLFFLYDFFMRHEANQRKIILEVKRRFVRFVSHEIRTPLNTVCLGLELLQAEMGGAAAATAAVTASSLSSVLPPDASRDDSKRGLVENDALRNQWMQLTEDILDNAGSAVRILDDLLSYDKIEQGTFNLDIGTVNIWNLIKSTVSAFRIQAEKRNITLELLPSAATAPFKPDWKPESAELEGAGPTTQAPSSQQQPPAAHIDLSHCNVYGDHIRLQQVLRNLISNALKFCPEHTGVIHVSSSYKADGLPKAAAPKVNILHKVSTTQLECLHPRAGSIVITVQDNGIGMTQEQLNRLFQEGVQFEANKHQGGGGSGLGLHISKSLIEQHGGTIVVDSAGPGLGATVTVELPLYLFPESKRSPAAAHTESTAAEADRLSDGSSPLSPKRNHHVLVVDDSLPNRKMLVRLLERSGHKCISACNGQEAIHVFDADQAALAADPTHTPIDTILMDYEMPVMNGPEATKVLRDNGCVALILGVTGNVLTEDIAYFKQMGADNVLAKPVQLTLLDDYWDEL